MARYMLDTDTCSYIMKRSSQMVLTRVKAVPVTDVCISVITRSELLYGVEAATGDSRGGRLYFGHHQVRTALRR